MLSLGFVCPSGEYLPAGSSLPPCRQHAVLVAVTRPAAQAPSCRSPVSSLFHFCQVLSCWCGFSAVQRWRSLPPRLCQLVLPPLSTREQARCSQTLNPKVQFNSASCAQADAEAVRVRCHTARDLRSRHPDFNERCLQAKSPPAAAEPGRTCWARRGSAAGRALAGRA